MWLFMAYLPPNVHLCLEHVLGRYASFSSHLSERSESKDLRLLSRLVSEFGD